jgi:hypothetical protein
MAVRITSKQALHPVGRMIPLGGSDELVAPERYTATVSGDEIPFIAEIECRVDADGRAHPVSLCLHAPEGRHLVPSEIRDHLALKRWVLDSLVGVTYTRPAQDHYEFDAEIDARAVRLTQGRARRQPISNRDRLVEVADTWLRASNAGEPPVKAVRALGWSAAQAQRLVNAARDAGLIPPRSKR